MLQYGVFDSTAEALWSELSFRPGLLQDFSGIDATKEIRK
jgi:hypothetical protein